MSRYNVQSLLFICFSLIINVACKMEISSPVADKIPQELTKHSDIRIDNYYWLKDLKNPKVIDYLRKENRYYDKETKKTDGFKKKLYEEMRSRIKEEDTSVPYFVNGYWYITRYEIGKEYPIYFRKKETLDSAEEILFDCNLMAKGHEYFDLVSISESPDNTKAVSYTHLTLPTKRIV